MEKYIQINALSEATDDEIVCACYPQPSKNLSGRKNSSCILEAEKDAMDGKCKLFVWRSLDDTSEERKFYTLRQKEVDQIITKYINAKTAMKEYQEQGNPEYKIEYGRSLALESVLEILGFDFEEMRRKYWIEGNKL